MTGSLPQVSFGPHHTRMQSNPPSPLPSSFLHTHRAPAGAAARQAGASRARGNARGRCPRAAASDASGGTESPRCGIIKWRPDRRPHRPLWSAEVCWTPVSLRGHAGRRTSRCILPRSSGRSAIARCAAVPPCDRDPDGPRPAGSRWSLMTRRAPAKPRPQGS